VTTSPLGRRQLGRGEFLALLSLTMALTALSIDLMLPAFGEIRAAFDIDPDSSQTAAIVTVYMIGLAVAQVLYGPIADRFGRKPALYVGFVLYALGALGAALAPSFGLLLASRLLWGMGAAGPRVISLAIVRDTHDGDQMARVMSFIMAVFILVPVMAPSIGAVIIAVAPWRGVFWFCVFYVAVIALWMIRMPETLDPSHRIEFRFDGIAKAARIVVSQRRAMAYTLAMTIMFGAFVSYLATSELIVDDVFGLEDRFPLIFGGFAALMGIAALTNAKVVGRFGSRRIVLWVTRAFVTGAASLVAIAMVTDGRPPFWLFAGGLAVVLTSYALLIPNLNTLAMEPMSRVAGTASALIGTTRTGGAAVLGSFIDRAYNGTITPLAIALLISGVLGYFTVRWAAAEREEQHQHA
jgi:DHA1 family bicyclomycin/chloramphenicol resistance-like MFS transporter